MLDEIHLEEQDKYPDSSFVVDAKGVVDPQDGSRDLKVKLTGEGNVKFVNGTVTLTSAGNTYSGKTIVATNSKLVIGSGSSLGQTRELNINKEGTVDASQEIVKVPGHTVNSGTLIIGEKTFTTETYDGGFHKFGKPVFPLRRQYPKQRREPQHRSDVEAFL